MTNPILWRLGLVGGTALAMALASAQGAVSLPSLISDHAVLQKSAKTTLWGKADPGEHITATIAGIRGETIASDGKWKIALDLSHAEQGPFDLVIEGNNKIIVHDVVVGEVWLASGQSNMDFTLNGAIGAAEEIAASANSQLRQFRVANNAASTVQEECKGKWVSAGPQTSGGFTAVGYYFSKTLQQSLQTPVGLINSSWCGTQIESWTSAEALDSNPDLKAGKDRINAEVESCNAAQGQQTAPQPSKSAMPAWNRPCTLYNGMIAPLVPYAIQGVIWYQGESNISRAYQYQTAFPLMINDWRQRWGRDFPFYFCQLASYGNKKPQMDAFWCWWAELREAQTKTLALPNTGEAILIDLGESADIHPRNKKDVGQRLAAVALAKTYGKPIPHSGPVCDSQKIEDGKIRLHFRELHGGLVARPLEAQYVVRSVKNETAPLVRNSPESQLEGFAICGENQKWQWADAKIEGETVVVSSSAVPQPVAVRYGWAANPTLNLYNQAGLPAEPFRTDSFPISTQKLKY